MEHTIPTSDNFQCSKLSYESDFGRLALCVFLLLLLDEKIIFNQTIWSVHLPVKVHSDMVCPSLVAKWFQHICKQCNLAFSVFGHIRAVI